MLHPDYAARLPSSPQKPVRASSFDRFLPFSAPSDMIGIDPPTAPASATAKPSATTATREDAVYRQLLVNEVAAPPPSPSSSSSSASAMSSLSTPLRRRQSEPGSPSRALLSSPRRMLSFGTASSAMSTTTTAKSAAEQQQRFSLTPLSQESVRLLTAPSACRRPIATSAFRVLEAPGLADDFYVAPLDWGDANTVAVSLRPGVFLWNATTASISRLSALEAAQDAVTAVSWRRAHPEQLAIADRTGSVRIFDVAAGSAVAAYRSHTRRIGAVAWTANGRIMATGSKDRSIALTDLRAAAAGRTLGTLREHRQEVCGVRWDPDGVWLASGGNDNKLVVWDVRQTQSPLVVWDQHRAAVKALAWSPRSRGALVSGGGSADRRLRFWDVRTLQPDGEVDTGSQVCNVHWSRNADELVTSHGFSQNQILVWDAAARTPIATLRGHTSRVLHLSVAPDGRTIVSGAGDQTLRFWAIFPQASATTVSAAPHATTSPFAARGPSDCCCSFDLR